MVGSIKIGNLNIRGTLRHRFEKEDHPLDNYAMWSKWDIGLWARRSKAVGKKNFKNPNEWRDHLRSVYTVGINLLIVKMWIDIDRGVMHF
jgi:hypothetical protein